MIIVIEIEEEVEAKYDKIEQIKININDKIPSDVYIMRIQLKFIFNFNFLLSDNF